MIIHGASYYSLLFSSLPHNTLSSKRRCCYKPADGHYKAKLNCNLLLLKSAKINPCSPAKGSSFLSSWKDYSCTHWSGYFFWIKRVFFNLLELWQSHPLLLAHLSWCDSMSELQLISSRAEKQGLSAITTWRHKLSLDIGDSNILHGWKGK